MNSSIISQKTRMVMYSREMKLQHFENGPFPYHLLLSSVAIDVLPSKVGGA